jgi:L-ascorbate metabolism protein UlaG (beta-lactamase superfamily)
MGRFEDRATTPARGPRDMLRWRWDRMRAGTPPDATSPWRAPVRPNDGALVRTLPASLTWIGHATFLLRLGGKLIATDPIWSSRISGVVPRLSPPGLALEAAPAIDVVTISHNHRDHLDAPTLRRIGPRALYVVPLGNGRLLRSLGLERIVELDWWQTHREGDLEITAVPARHWSMRYPWDRNDMLWSGFVFRGPEGAAYHAGDTGFFDGFAEIGERLGPLDHALMPIGAYAPRWFMQPQHLDPDEAVEAFEALGARHLVAMHWGTFRLTDEPLVEPPSRIRALWEARGAGPDRLWLMDVGETRAIGRR